MSAVMTVLGARPQFIKAAPVSRALAGLGIEEALVHTGQHFDPNMSQVFFDELGLMAPAYHLGISGSSPAAMTGAMMLAVDDVIASARPDVLLVYGDTSSTLAGAVAGAQRHVPVVHVEAGLRSFDRTMPEEVNRVLTDHVAVVLACPTFEAVRNLASEGIISGVHHVGDVMYDAALWARERVADAALPPGCPDGAFAVATVHRAATTDDPVELRRAIDFLRHEVDMPVVVPLHPRTRHAVDAAKIDLEGLIVLEPVGFLTMTRLLLAAELVLTDSGGLQKEAYFHRVPCITLRSTTEWTETIEAGWNRLWTHTSWRTPRHDIDEYGDGRAAERIAELVAEMIS